MPAELPPVTALIHPSDALAIVQGRHPDPFSILGGHETEQGYIVCVFDPGADEMQVLTGKSTETQLLPVADATGVFVGRLKRKAAYQLRGKANGNSWVSQDPYRFGPVIGSIDEHLLSEGTHRQLWRVLGAHVMKHEGSTGTHFAVWAPNAQRVSVVGEFNFWDGRRHVMRRLGNTGVWEIFLPDVADGAVYKYEIMARNSDILPLKADPFAFSMQHAPETGSVVCDIAAHQWDDAQWIESRANLQDRCAPISIYEVHLGSWRRVVEQDNRPLTYRECAVDLVDYAVDMGFTHLEFLPVSEFPFEGSWGYQPIGFYAPTTRYGSPQDFRFLIEAAHKKGLGILLDWVPGHFPTDAHGLGQFDGTALYEYADPKEGFHLDWNTLIFNYGRLEVKNYLVANALYWLQEHHIDGLRVDAVASMLYRDYSRPDDQWIPNAHGGRENLEAISFLTKMNETVYGECPGIMTAAEESTAFPMVSAPTDVGGLGFGFKWNMGWMHDTLDYIKHDPIHRKYHHHQMTFGTQYAFTENFILPISHDEVVHGKGSMITKMPGEGGEKFANLRSYYAYMWTQPGKKLLFMGCEFAQEREWNHDRSLDWHLLEQHDWHTGMQSLVRDLNYLYRKTPALHVKDCDPSGFAWIDANAEAESIYAYLRQGEAGDKPVAIVCNFDVVEHQNWRIGLPVAGCWSQVLNTDAPKYGGQGRGLVKAVATSNTEWHGQKQSVELTLPPLSTLIFQLDKGDWDAI